MNIHIHNITCARLRDETDTKILKEIKKQHIVDVSRKNFIYIANNFT